MSRVSIGERFGRWTVVAAAPKGRSGPRWLCRCDCGAERSTDAWSLASGHSRSCGCGKREPNLHNRKHGESIYAGNTAEYRVWLGIRNRCSNANEPTYPHYGGRGIRVCERWDDFAAFLADMGRRPSPKHTIDRVDNDGDYAPGNCRWVTMTEQANNRRNNHRLTIGGETKTIAQWSRETGVNQYAIAKRLRRGWNPERAIAAPVRVTSRVSTP